MPTPLLFVQGAGKNVHDSWDDKLVASLRRELGADYAIHYPRMPDEANPRYATWKATLLQEFKTLEPSAILLGHSVGGTVLLHTLADDPPARNPSAIVLLAPPFLGPGGWPSDDIPQRADFAGRLPAGVPLFLYHGTADATVPPAHAKLYANAIPQAVIRMLDGRDHQLHNDLSDVARDLQSSVPRIP